MAALKQVSACSHCSDQTSECDLSDFECAVILVLILILTTTASRVHREWCEKQKTSSEPQFRPGVTTEHLLTILTRRSHSCQLGTGNCLGWQWVQAEDKLPLGLTNLFFIVPHADGMVWFWWEVPQYKLYGKIPTQLCQWNTMAMFKRQTYISIVADQVHPFMATVYPSSKGF